jgi:hypothetical protein
MENVTKLENKVLAIISRGDDYEGVPTECLKSIMNYFNGTQSQLQDVLTSLIRKDLVWMGEYPNGIPCFHLVK